MITEVESFNLNHPDLCPHLRWKGMLVGVEWDPTVPPTNDGSFWCLFSQTCIGPDGGLVEPGECCSTGRACHGTGKV
ncbi:MAG: hypothetical protein AB1631_09220 [Acidobacteriota bacterium]